MNNLNAAISYDSNVSSQRTKSSYPAATLLQYERRVLIEDVDGRWGDEVRNKLQSLVRLSPGWDGYEAIPVSFTNAVFALQMLEKVCTSNTPAPAIVPGVEGDLQLEWHTAKGDIELHVLAPNNVHAWHAKLDGENPDEEERVLKNDFSIVAEWVKEIAGQHANT